MKSTDATGPEPPAVAPGPAYRGDINGGGPELYLEADDGDVALRTR